jgi:hypothetical protein
MNSFEMTSPEQKIEQSERMAESRRRGIFIDEYGETNLQPLNLPEPESPTDEEMWEQEKIKQSIAKTRGRQFRASGLCPAYIKERFAKPESGEPK